MATMTYVLSGAGTATNATSATTTTYSTVPYITVTGVKHGSITFDVQFPVNPFLAAYNRNDFHGTVAVISPTSVWAQELPLT